MICNKCGKQPTHYRRNAFSTVWLYFCKDCRNEETDMPIRKDSEEGKEKSK